MWSIAQGIIVVVFTLLMATFIILLVYRYQRRQYKNKKEQLLLKAHFEQTLLQTQLEIQEQTLQRLSEEIHDNVGQILSLAKLNLNTLSDFASEKMQQKATIAKEMVSKAIIDLRNLSKSMHGNKIEQLGLLEAIRSELAIIESSGQFTTELAINGNPFSLTQQREIILFRIAQIALGNAIKHSMATHIIVTLDYTDAKIALKVKDNGKGFDPRSLDPTQTGIGLTNIYNRASLINGVIFVNSSIGNGTVVSVEVVN